MSDRSFELRVLLSEASYKVGAPRWSDDSVEIILYDAAHRAVGTFTGSDMEAALASALESLTAPAEGTVP
jgi:hypothetical protein